MNEKERLPDSADMSIWNKAIPEELPKPTYWPFFLAMGFAFLCWGILASWIISAAGLCILVLSLKGWIKILRNEARTE